MMKKKKPSKSLNNCYLCLTVVQAAVVINVLLIQQWSVEQKIIYVNYINIIYRKS